MSTFESMRREIAAASALLKSAFQPMPGDAAPPAPPAPAPAGPPPGPPGAPPAGAPPPMDPAAMMAAMPPGAGAPPPVDPAAMGMPPGAAPGGPAGIDPSVLMELLQGMEQMAQLVQSFSGRVEQQEQKLMALMKDQAKTAAQLDFMIKLIREQPTPPAGMAAPPEAAPLPGAPMAPGL